jgi:hypothetical protein
LCVVTGRRQASPDQLVVEPSPGRPAQLPVPDVPEVAWRAAGLRGATLRAPDAVAVPVAFFDAVDLLATVDVRAIFFALFFVLFLAGAATEAFVAPAAERLAVVAAPEARAVRVAAALLPAALRVRVALLAFTVRVSAALRPAAWRRPSPPRPASRSAAETVAARPTSAEYRRSSAACFARSSGSSPRVASWADTSARTRLTRSSLARRLRSTSSSTHRWACSRWTSPAPTSSRTISSARARVTCPSRAPAST